MENNNSVQSIERAFRILDVMREKKRELGVNELASLIGLGPTTTHRLLQSLVSVKAVRQNSTSKKYTLAPHMLLYGKAVLDQFDFIRSVHPFLGELSKEAGETVFMGILDDFELVYVDHVDSLDHSLRMTPQIGRRQEAHCTALGKVLLSNLDYRQREKFLSNCPYKKLTENTLATEEELRMEFKKIIENGYGLDLEEAENGICCIAAPIVGIEGKVIAAISISGPASRIRKKGMDTFLRELIINKAKRINQFYIS